jgi:hypothetical protein
MVKAIVASESHRLAAYADNCLVLALWALVHVARPNRSGLVILEKVPVLFAAHLASASDTDRRKG